MVHAIPDRRGTVYLLVLVVTALVVATSLAGLAAARGRQRSLQLASDAMRARHLARSAVELGMAMIQADPAWRTTMPNGTWFAGRAVGGGTMDLTVVDPGDGDLADNDEDGVKLTGVGMVGAARQKMSLAMSTVRDPLEVLSRAAWSSKDLTFSGSTVVADAPMGSNRDVIASLASVGADVEAGGDIIGGTYLAGTNAKVPAKALPAADALDHYLTVGTAIDINGLPTVVENVDGVDVTFRAVRQVVLSPASNPYGSTNASGVYVLACGGQHVQIRNCRIVGTVVLLDPGTYSRVEGNVNWAPAVANYPVLLVQGVITIRSGSLQLSESLYGVNFNPPGTPYEGSEDNDTLDSYPSVIRGLVYATGNMTVEEDVTVEGLLLTDGKLTVYGVLMVTHDEVYATAAPPGFQAPPRLIVSSNGWSREVD